MGLVLRPSRKSREGVDIIRNLIMPHSPSVYRYAGYCVIYIIGTVATTLQNNVVSTVTDKQD